MRIIYNILGVLVATSVLLSCVRKNEVLEPIVLPAGGETDSLGATIKVTPQHHKTGINDAMVYIKYAATTMPAMDQFDDSVAAGIGAASFDSLTQGDYYLYATGKDLSLEKGKDEVYGGAHFRIIDSVEKTYDLYLQMDNHIHHEYRR